LKFIAYVIGLTGWLMLFIYSYMKGDFPHIEGPKYEILEIRRKNSKSRKKEVNTNGRTWIRKHKSGR